MKYFDQLGLPSKTETVHIIAALTEEKKNCGTNYIKACSQSLSET